MKSNLWVLISILTTSCKYYKLALEKFCTENFNLTHKKFQPKIKLEWIISSTKRMAKKFNSLLQLLQLLNTHLLQPSCFLLNLNFSSFFTTMAGGGFWLAGFSQNFTSVSPQCSCTLTKVTWCPSIVTSRVLRCVYSTLLIPVRPPSTTFWKWKNFLGLFRFFWLKLKQKWSFFTG